jgi:hypothetical protein
MYVDLPLNSESVTQFLVGKSMDLCQQLFCKVRFKTGLQYPYSNGNPTSNKPADGNQPSAAPTALYTPPPRDSLHRLYHAI